MEGILDVLEALTKLPPLLLYLILGLGAAIENVIPPVPADTFVIVGALLAAQGNADTRLVFLFTWLFNVASAVAVYLIARRYGRSFFRLPVAHWLLKEHQLDQIGGFYGKYGVPAIFMSRFLPAWRAMVPVFAGISGMSPWRVIPPLAIASGLWYGLLVYLGAYMGRNLPAIIAIFSNVSDVLLGVALILIAAVGYWWWRSRHPAPHGHE